ncbi:sugar porter (SP) family MFS transporter [Wenyingzhuangia heitensis]|uniref:Sugar porter (SP) family MFS transporter n=1 Tax=Wenyingzhuangia heitensis TaxID=1487859 RepID=A0ABX0U7N5_9FLAO|nr:sugar porter family MFS transporter [Wenyingzhuangia heitensis]NIJ44863.1 sugar porter (SP) family MFS transporter [Wenyingzhuangia heitensis]
MGSHKLNAFVYAGIVAIGGFIFGLDAAVISGTVKYLTQEFALSEMQIGFVVSAPGFGVLPALPLAGYLSNKLGRKKALQLVALLYLVSAVCSTFAPTYLTLVLARFLGGMAFCSLSLATMYIGEIAPPKWRGKLVSINQINIVIGLSAAYFVNYLIIDAVGVNSDWITSLGIKENTWRWMLGSEIIPAFLWLILLFFIPESPSWLVFNNQIKAAKKTLRKIMPNTEVDEHVAGMVVSLATSEKNQSVLDQFKEIVSKPMRLTLIIGVTVALVQQITGINAILFYAPTVFEQLGIGTDAAFIQAIWVGVTGLFFTILAIVFIDRIGRRPMIVWGTLWLVLSLGICSYGFKTARYKLVEEDVVTLTEFKNKDLLMLIVGKEFKSDAVFKKELKLLLGEKKARIHASNLIQKAVKLNTTLILFGILSFIAAFHFSIGPVLWVLFSEIFPISLRGIAIPSFAFITSITSYFVQLFFPWQLANMGASSVFLFYAVLGLIGFVILFRFLPETKNLSIEEIQKKLIKKT